MFRIQKLLKHEYCDFEEMVLVESPFAQVTSSGVGIKQVQIAITPTKLIIGKDTFDRTKSCTLANVFNHCGEDPEIESMELVNVLPLEFLYIKVFRKGTRQLMKVSIGTAKIMWFEFGGYLSRNVHWSMWRDRISTLRANQNRMFYTEVPQFLATHSSTTITTTTNSIPDQLQVTAEVYRENSELLNTSRPTLNFTCCEDERTKICPSVKDFMGSYNFFSRSNSIGRLPSNLAKFEHSSAPSLGKSDRELVLREVAEYFLETQSDIVIGQHTFGLASCEGSCKDFHFRSASVANLNDFWNSGYDGL